MPKKTQKVNLIPKSDWERFARKIVRSARTLYDDIYTLCSELPSRLDYLADQMERSANSVGANTAQAIGGYNPYIPPRNFSKDICIARGELRELGFHLVNVKDVGELSEQRYNDFHSRIKSMYADLTKLLHSLEHTIKR